MHALLLFNALCASRGDGLLPELVALLERPPASVEASRDVAELIHDHAARGRECPSASRHRLPPS